jgi:hypothetical protein
LAPTGGQILDAGVSACPRRANVQGWPNRRASPLLLNESMSKRGLRGVARRRREFAPRTVSETRQSRFRPEKLRQARNRITHASQLLFAPAPRRRISLWPASEACRERDLRLIDRVVSATAMSTRSGKIADDNRRNGGTVARDAVPAQSAARSSAARRYSARYRRPNIRLLRRCASRHRRKRQ